MDYSLPGSSVHGIFQARVLVRLLEIIGLLLCSSYFHIAELVIFFSVYFGHMVRGVLVPWSGIEPVLEAWRLSHWNEWIPATQAGSILLWSYLLILPFCLFCPKILLANPIESMGGQLQADWSWRAVRSGVGQLFLLLCNPTSSPASLWSEMTYIYYIYSPTFPSDQRV